MKYLKLFEEIDIDFDTDIKMRDANTKMIKGAKTLESELKNLGIKFISKNTNSSDDARKLRKEALNKIINGDENAYGIMKWTTDNSICQSFEILVPAKGIEFLRKPIAKFGLSIHYNEEPGKWGALEVYNSPGKGKSKSLYMTTDGDVLYQWDDYDNSAKGSLTNNTMKKEIF